MFVEFQRVAVAPQQSAGTGEDDGLPVAAGAPEPLPLSVNPLYVAAVTPSQQEGPNVTIIKLANSTGYAVRGSYTEVLERLAAGGRQVTH